MPKSSLRRISKPLIAGLWISPQFAAKTLKRQASNLSTNLGVGRSNRSGRAREVHKIRQLGAAFAPPPPYPQAGLQAVCTFPSCSVLASPAISRKFSP